MLGTRRPSRRQAFRRRSDALEGLPRILAHPRHRRWGQNRTGRYRACDTRPYPARREDEERFSKRRPRRPRANRPRGQDECRSRRRRSIASGASKAAASNHMTNGRLLVGRPVRLKEHSLRRERSAGHPARLCLWEFSSMARYAFLQRVLRPYGEPCKRRSSSLAGCRDQA